jgi:hypothetical protein
LTLTDEATKDAPRNSKGVRISMADFDMTASGPSEGQVVGKYSGASSYTACVCQSATVGSEATITAKYPAASLAKREGAVEGVAFESSIKVPIVASRSKSEPAECAPVTTTTLSTAGAPAPTTTPVTTPITIAPAALAVAPSRLTTAPPGRSPIVGPPIVGPPIGPEAQSASDAGPSRWTGTLLIDGVSTPVSRVSGGSAVADVVLERTGGLKHLAGISYEPIVLSFAPTAGMISWINSGWAGTPVNKSGTVSAHLGSSSTAIPAQGGRLDFSDAKILTTRIPALVAGAETFQELTVSIGAPLVKRGPLIADPPASSSSAYIAGFRLAVSGLESAGVREIESFVAEAPKIVSSPGADPREYSVVTLPPTFSNLVVTISESQSPAWIAWYNDFVIKGNSGSAQEKTFTLDLLNKSGATLATIRGYGVGIFALRASDKTKYGSPFLVAELYVERMEILPASGGAAAPAAAPAVTP